MHAYQHLLRTAAPLLAVALASGCVIDRRVEEAPSLPDQVQQVSTPLYEVADAYVTFQYAPPLGKPYGGLDGERVAHLRIYDHAALLTLPNGEMLAVPFARLHDSFRWRPAPRPAAEDAPSPDAPSPDAPGE